MRAAVAAVLERRLCDAGYQFCVFDPEGDFEGLLDSVMVGGLKSAPAREEIRDLLRGFKNTVISLQGVAVENRAEFFAGLFPDIQGLRARTGRPQWVVFEEAHHLMPEARAGEDVPAADAMRSTVLVTVHPEHVSHVVLRMVDTVIGIDGGARETVAGFCRATGRPLPAPLPEVGEESGKAGDVVLWEVNGGEGPRAVTLERGRSEHVRHLRHYAQGDVREKSFVFRGPEDKLQLKAQNLGVFLQMADGVDDATWEFHRRRHDYSRWIDLAIKDGALARRVGEIEAALIPAGESRRKVREAVEERYSGAA